jgi:hypothetical protein
MDAACGERLPERAHKSSGRTPATGTNATTCVVDVIVSDGPRVVSGTAQCGLHNSAAEVSGMALEFLNEFADSQLPADERMLRNFSDTPNECREGKAAELKDVQDNRKKYDIKSHNYGAPTTTINFGGVCAFRSRPPMPVSPRRGMEFHET